METTVEELPESRVRVEVDVDAADVDARIQQTAQRLGTEIRLPGFRKGKVPPEMVVQRLGRDTVLRETLEHSLAEWYERALIDSGVTAIGDPSLDVPGMPAAGEPLRFSFEVAVRPKANLGEYRGVEAGRAQVEVPEEAVTEELDRLRDGFARLQTVQREAKEGDVVVADFQGTVDEEPFEGGEARDYLIELGGGQLQEGFEEALAGASAGDERTAEIDFPEDHPSEQLRGKRAQFQIKVKEVREKELPELNDDFAAEASEFDTLEELRGHIEERIREALDARTEEAFREAALDAVVEQSTVEVPESLAKARATESWERFEHSLGHRGVSGERWLELQGKTKEEFIDEAKPGAERALKREAVLEAVADAEQIEPTEEDMIEAIRPAAEADGSTPEQVLERLRARGRDALLRGDLRMRKALDVIAEGAKAIPLEQAEAREKLWTPEKEREEKSAEGLWTPGGD